MTDLIMPELVKELRKKGLPLPEYPSEDTSGVPVEAKIGEIIKRIPPSGFKALGDFLGIDIMPEQEGGREAKDNDKGEKSQRKGRVYLQKEGERAVIRLIGA